MPRKRKPGAMAAPIAGDPGQPTTQGREVRFVYPDGRKWDSVALVVLEDGTLDYCHWALWLMTIAPLVIGVAFVLAFVFGLGWLWGRR